jgi:hypothetical protein
MSQIHRFPIVFALTLAPALTVGCATAPPAVPAYTPQFTYSYPPGEAPASDVTIAIVRPIDADASAVPTPGTTLAAPSKKRAQVEADFKSGIVAQLQELFHKKGFRQTGPFDDLNSMTFPDKKGSDLTLTTQVGLRVAIPEEHGKIDQGFGDQLVGTSVAFVESQGPCSATGYISFVMLEPLSGEKIWIKKVDMPPTQVDCSGKGPLGDFNVIDNGYAQLLERAFQLTMKKAWDYLAPEEVTLLKKQSQELRAKKVY